MEILNLAFSVYNIIGTGFSIVDGINFALKRSHKTTAEKLFKKSFVEAVNQHASDFADLTDPKKVDVDTAELDKIIASLKDVDEVQFTQLNESEKIAKITTLFHYCLIVPNHSLTKTDFERRIRPIIERAIIDFYKQLSLKQEAFNQVVLELIQDTTTEQANLNSRLKDFWQKIEQVQLEVNERLTQDIQAIKSDTEKIKDDTVEIKQKTQATLDLVSKVKSQFDVNISNLVEIEVAKEHQTEIGNAQELIKSHKPTTAFELLKILNKRIGARASEGLKFSILTNMAAAQLALNNEQESAKLLLKAFQYNPEDESALSNRALAHLLLGDPENAEKYAKQTLEKNPANTHAYAILVGISAEKEPLAEVIAKVPDYLRDSPQIASAISNLAKQRRNFEEAKKWGKTTVEKGDPPVFKASLATILIEQVLADHVNMCTQQIDASQEEQLDRAVELLSAAWDCVADTELRTARADWIINRSTALQLLGRTEAAIKDLDTAIEIEPAHSMLLRNRSLLAFEQGDRKRAIDFLEKIQSQPEIYEAQILVANILFADKRYDEAITKLDALLKTNPSSELQDKAKCWLVRVHIAAERIKEAELILTPMLKSSPTSVLNLINAALISSKKKKNDEAISHLIEAYNYTLDSKDFLEIVELAAELFIHEQFKEAATLYEKIADTNQNSQLTQWLVQSYYNSGEIAKALRICQKLREKYGPLENVSVMEVVIYEEIGDMKQAETVCKEYLNKFPTDYDMQIRLGMVLFRSNKMAEVDNVLESLPDSKNFSFLKELPLEGSFQLALLHQKSKPQKALKIMYEVRRMRYNEPDAHLKYISVFHSVEKEIREILNPTQVEKDTAVQINISDQDWYIIEERDDADITRNERDMKDPLVQKLLKKQKNVVVRIGKKTVEILGIKSKFSYAYQESLRKYEHLFPTDEGMETVKLDDSSEIDDKERFRPMLDKVDQQYEIIRQIEELYQDKYLTIGFFTNLAGGNSLDTWSSLMANPKLGIRCSIGNTEERNNALSLLNQHNLKLVVDIISLITLHCLDAANIVVDTFGKLCIAQSTIDELQRIISEREGMWSKREGMIVGKKGNRYVKQIINPEETKHGIEYLKKITDWIRKNCEIGQATVGLEINQLRRRELNSRLQQHFLDTILLASQPGHLLFSDDGHLRHYAKTNFNKETATNFQIDGVWTQVLLEHCVKQKLLDKVDYDEMTIKLVCSRYYHTAFDADLLLEIAKRANWTLLEPYNSFMLALGAERMNLNSALDVTADFLFKLWDTSALFRQKEFLTLGLLTGLTFGRNTHTILKQLESRIQNRYILFLPTKNSILKRIQDFRQICPLENNFEFLAEDDIRLKGTRVGIETILCEYIHASKTPVVIADHYYTLTLEQVYATILYYLQNQEEVGAYLDDYLKYRPTEQAG